MCLPVVFLAAESIKETKAAVRFATVDVYVDSSHDVLAAYQLEWTGQSANARIVGIEGGENSAFKEPPYYDPNAMQQERVILASFSTANAAKLPRGKTRV